MPGITVSLQLKKYDDYKDDTIGSERDAILKRRTQLLDDAKSEMATVTASLSPSLAVMTETIARYEMYPEETRQAYEALKTKKVQVITKVKDDLAKGLTLDDIDAIDSLLSEFKEKPELAEEVRRCSRAHASIVITPGWLLITLLAIRPLLCGLSGNSALDTFGALGPDMPTILLTHIPVTSHQRPVESDGWHVLLR